MKRAVFLDRDGVINRSIVVRGVPTPPTNIQNVEILEGVKEAIELMRGHGLIPIVITNQPDVARGKVSQNRVEKINSFIGSTVNIEEFYTCFHDDLDKCECRKPAPGLIFQASMKLGVDIPNSYLVGDRWKDIEAGQKAGCKTFFIDYSYSEKRPKKPFQRVSSLLEAVQIMIGEIDGTKL